MDDLLADFVAETREMLEASEGEIIAWEADPENGARIDAIFRFVHTVKGNCGFFDFPRLASLSHEAENVLADVRAGRRQADTALVSAVLAIIDRIMDMIEAIETQGSCPDGDDEALVAALTEGAEATLAGDTGSAEPDVNASETLPETADDTAQNTSPVVQRTIRLPVDLLDRVMSGVSDMVLARNDLAHRLRQAGNQPTIDGPFERLTTILSDVRDAITRMRMQRIETLYNALPRLVRDLAEDLGKKVLIDLEGGDVELDREMIEMIRDPVTHIIRNAVDHGLETPEERLKKGKPESGVVSITARQSGNKISMVITDDGRGVDENVIAAKALSMGLVSEADLQQMDREKILQLVFEPGFSTAASVSTISGRGVGLDVVRSNLEKVGGSIKMTSTPGTGALFYLQIPLTLAIISGLTVTVGDQRFAIPQSYVEEVVDMGSSGIEFVTLGETSLITFRGQRTPCISLSDVLGIAGKEDRKNAIFILVRLASGDLFALEVDAIHSISDLVVKPLPRSIMQSDLYGGSTLLDDGQPILVLDLPLIALNQGLVSETRSVAKRRTEIAQGEFELTSERVMLFTDFESRRRAVRLELVQRIETAPAHAIDVSSASPRAVIDGVILPLIGLPDGPLPAEKVRLLRLTDGSCELLYAVRDIDDAAALASPLKPVKDDPMIEGVTLIEGQAISVIDGHEVFARYGEPPAQVDLPKCRLPDSDWARTILSPLVASAGYEIVAADSESAEDILSIWFEDEYESAQALELPITGPIIRLRDHPDAPQGCKTIYRYDRAALAEALRMARAQAAVNNKTSGEAA
ncbi:MAG: chemotaxis protein CheA [Erythrobacter sp.]